MGGSTWERLARGYKKARKSHAARVRPARGKEGDRLTNVRSRPAKRGGLRKR